MLRQMMGGNLAEALTFYHSREQSEKIWAEHQEDCQGGGATGVR